MRVGEGLKRAPARALQLDAAASTSAVPITTAHTFVHARDTPRASDDLFDPPPRGTVWKFEPTHVNADGADAGPKAIKDVCMESNAAYKQNRGHCSVHVQRNVQQKKHEVFNGDTDAHKRSASVVNSMLEQLKDHSTLEPHAQAGKRLLLQHLEHGGERAAAAYMEHMHLKNKITLVEMNATSSQAKGKVRK